ncbi:hypothetical protein [Flavobacterium wongokense]|uniref:hypothetical protein n=1 Tax=Flavobacterium wongokense TaxID=2910674 RepID=UPI001F29BEE7|nr:hypothetical protein [Flavobacterium sp. WG47]MCF6132470.1 hypothetical protein [Flavobacterium sp. WG47]
MTIASQFKITFFLTIGVFSCVAHAQENLNDIQVLSSNSRGYHDFNFKGQVKSVKTRYVSIKASLSNYAKEQVMLKNDVRNNNCLEFYQNGLLKMQYGDIPSFEFTAIDSTKLEIQQFDTKDVVQKNKYKPILSNATIFQNPELFVNYDLYRYSYQFGQTIDGVEHLGISQFNYVYKTDENNRITESYEYWPYNENMDTVRIKNVSEKDLVWRLKFLYNDKNQLISQKIIPGHQQDGGSYAALGTESGFSPDLQLKYKYDNKGRVIQAVFWGNNGIISSEDYEYDPMKGYVQKVRYYITGPGEISNPTKRYVKTFNENGDIIEKEFIPDFPGQNIAPLKRYYDYEYDSHQNWVKCNMYLEGKKEGEPTLTAERKIEYYE